MSLLEPPAETANKSRVMIFTSVTLVLVAALLLYLTFRYYPEKKAAEHFFNALEAGNPEMAYQLWKPSDSYAMKDFLADWGPGGYYGTVKSYKILSAKAPKNSPAVAVTVQISPYSPMPDATDAEKSRKTRVVSVWVMSSDKSFSFPP
ncbi:MAG: hypothetical protein PVS2B2_28240 [Candidatus Acidiferrum sp.]